MVITTSVYLIILATLVAGRLLELVISARHRKIALTAGALESPRDRYRLMVAFHVLFFVSTVWEVFWFKRPFPGTLGWVALGGAFAAQVLRYWTITTLGLRWNTRVIVFPDAAPVTAGPYRFIRHPNYLAVIVEMVCVPMIHGCWLTAIVFSIGNAAVLTLRIRNEEESLGKRYALAMGDRPRFFISLSSLSAHLFRKRLERRLGD